ncbi:MAG: choline kinase family protein [Acidimicrobiales bacterium]
MEPEPSQIEAGLLGLLDSFWPGGWTSVSELAGGITNSNYKVVAGGQAYVLRAGGPNAAALGIDRRLEAEAARLAASLGVGPEVVAATPEGHMVTRFVDGAPVSAERLREPDVICQVARALRVVHAGGEIGGGFAVFRVVESYWDIASSSKQGAAVVAELAGEHDRLAGTARRVEGAHRGGARVFCHNDLLSANLIERPGGALTIVDWEYAGMGDPFFDLANLAVNHDFDAEQAGLLLRTYLSAAPPAGTSNAPPAGTSNAPPAGWSLEEARRAFELMRFMSAMREAMWAVVQCCTSELSFDFGAYLEDQLEKARRIAAEPVFLRALSGS